METKSLLSYSIAVSLLMSACGPTPSDTPAASTSQADSTSAEVIQEETSAIFFSTPSSLPDCTRTVVTLQWDVRSEHPEVETVKILVGEENEEQKTFSIVSSVGTKETGEWVRPGGVFELVANDTDNKNLLGRIVIGGPKCN